MGIVGSTVQSLFDTCNNTVIYPNIILMLGLDSAGKTTILYKMKLGEIVTSTPTIGFNIEVVSPWKGAKYTVWDIGGGDGVRPLWRTYFPNSQGMIYVVDSTDRERFPKAQEALFSVFVDNDPIPVVVIANKQDLPGAAGTEEIADKLALTKLRSKWVIHAANALTGEGIDEAMGSLTKLVREYRRSRR